MEGFNLRKKITKGVGVGMVVAGSLLMPKESFTQRDTKIEDTKNKTEVAGKNNNTEEYRNTYLEYMEHPSYKERLAKEMFGDSYDEKLDGLELETEYKKRLDNLKTLTIHISPEEFNSFYQDGIVQSSQSAAYHEISHGVDQDLHGNKKRIGLRNKIDSLKSPNPYKNEADSGYKIQTALREKIFEELNKYLELNPNFVSELDIPVNEYSGEKYSSQKIDKIKMYPESYIKLFPKNYQDLFKDDITKILEIDKILNKESSYEPYWQSTTEIAARINALKLEAFEKYGYNPKNDFDINKFPELKKNKFYLQLINEAKYDDERINELSKYVADAGIQNSGDENIA